ncbi:lipopolysaccharide biosynthesis protein [Bradyrhizobium lupini]
MAVLDQLLVGLSNFGISIGLANELGPKSFGEYTLIQAYLLYSTIFQLSFVIAPMLVRVPAESHDNRIRIARSFSALNLITVLLAVPAVGLLATILGLLNPALSLVGFEVHFAFAAVGYSFQDWLRRALFSLERPGIVLLLDALTYGGQLAALLLWHLYSELTVETALLSLGAPFALTSIAFIFLFGLTPSFHDFRLLLLANIRTGRNLFLAGQLQWVGSLGTIFWGASRLGIEAAGAIRAIQSLLGPFNLVLQVMDNVVPVRAASLLVEKGGTSLSGYLLGLATLASGAAVFALIGVYLLGPMMLSYVLKPEYSGFVNLLLLQAIYYVLAVFYRLQTYYLRVLDKTKIILCASGIWALVSITLVYGTAKFWGAEGVLAAVIAGLTAGGAVMAVFSSRITWKNSAS